MLVVVFLELEDQFQADADHAEDRRGSVGDFGCDLSCFSGLADELGAGVHGVERRPKEVLRVVGEPYRLVGRICKREHLGDAGLDESADQDVALLLKVCSGDEDFLYCVREVVVFVDEPDCIFRGGGAACPAWREPRVRTRRSHPFGTNVIQRLLSHRPHASTCRVLHQ